MKGDFEKIIGKTITSVVVATNNQHHNDQVLLVFSDGTSFEIYGSSFSGASGLDRGGVADACSYAKKCGGHVSVYPPNEQATLETSFFGHDSTTQIPL